MIITIPAIALAALMACLAVGSTVFGWTLGMRFQSYLITQEIRDKAVGDYQKQFVERFSEEFEKQVYIKAEELLEEKYDFIVEQIKQEMEKENEGTGSN